MRATKSMMLGFASLCALGAYLLHPILWLVTIIIFIDITDD